MMLGLDFRKWLGGLVSAVLSGGASAVVTVMGLNIVDPGHFAASDPDFFKSIGMIFSINGTLAFFNYIKQTPMPSFVERTTEIHTIEKTIEPAPKPEESANGPTSATPTSGGIK